MRPLTKFTLPKVIVLVVVLGFLAVNLIVIAGGAIGNALREPSGLQGVAKAVAELDGVAGTTARGSTAPGSDWRSDGSVIMNPKATPADIRAALDVTGHYLAGQDAGSDTAITAVGVVIGETVLRVYREESDNAEQVRLYERLPRLPDGDAEIVSAGFFGESVLLTVDRPSQLADGWTAITELVTGSSLSADAATTVQSRNGRFSVTSTGPGQDPGYALSLYGELAELYPLSDAVLDADSAELTLSPRASESDLDSARTLVTRVGALPATEASSSETGMVEVIVNGASDADRAARDLISATRSIKGLSSVRADDGGKSIRYEVANASTAYVVYAAIRDLPEFTRLDSFAVSSEGYPTRFSAGEFEVTTTPDDAPRGLAMLNALSEAGITDAIALDYSVAGDDAAEAITVDLIDDSRETIRAAVAQLKSQYGGAARAELSVRDPRTATTIASTFILAPAIEPVAAFSDDSAENQADQLRLEFAEAWNG